MEVMFDIETLDVKPSSVVLSIGAVLFDDTGRTWDTFYRALEIQPQLDAGRTVSESTLMWWMNQDDMAKRAEFTAHRSPVLQSLMEFDSWCRRERPGASTFSPPEVYWALGPQFDAVILEDLARSFNTSAIPWGYRQLRDVRTVCLESGVEYWNTGTTVKGVAHTPVYDCEVQIENLMLTRGKKVLT